MITESTFTQRRGSRSDSLVDRENRDEEKGCRHLQLPLMYNRQYTESSTYMAIGILTTWWRLSIYFVRVYGWWILPVISVWEAPEEGEALNRQRTLQSLATIST